MPLEDSFTVFSCAQTSGPRRDGPRFISSLSDTFTTMSENGEGYGTYCVSGDTLTIITSPDGGSMTGTGSGGDLVATRE